MTEEEVLKYFNKWYVAPEDLAMVDKYISQDWMSFDSREKTRWIKLEVQSTGLLNFSIELERGCDIKGVYPEIKYFLSKVRNQAEISRSHIRPEIREQDRATNVYVTSRVDKWQEYRIDYHKGYTNKVA